MMAKFDLDNFYGNVPHRLVKTSIEWLLNVMGQKLGPRKQVVCIPRSQRVEWQANQSFTRAYGGYLRNVSKDRLKPHFEHMRCNSRTHHVLHLRDLADVVMVELETAVLWLCTTAVAWSHGLTQGSSLASGICLACSCYLEASVLRFNRKELGMYTRYVVQRWVDDIHMVIQCWTTAMYSGIAARQVAEGIRDTIVELYAVEFAMKVEQSNEFVGIAVEYHEIEGLITAPRSHIDFRAGGFGRVLFQHVCSNVPRYQLMRTVVGMIYQSMDRCLCDATAERALAKLFVDFFLAGYSWSMLRRAVRAVQLKHPYLAVLDRGYNHGQQIVEIYCRKRL